MLETNLKPNGNRIQPSRMPQQVANRLREDILTGRLADGQRLPKEAELRTEFGVGRPVMREAIRVLEAEGLLKVIRGNQGGAIVQAPRPGHTAYALAMIMKARGARTQDLGTALRELEPICAGLCARRPDRMETVLPTLRRIQQDALRHIDDPEAVTSALRAFHEALVAGCGNEVLGIVVGALESLWSAHVQSSQRDVKPTRSREQLERSIEEHAHILERIEAGDDVGAQAAVHAHVMGVQGAATPANRPADINIEILAGLLG